MSPPVEFLFILSYFVEKAIFVLNVGGGGLPAALPAGAGMFFGENSLTEVSLCGIFYI